MLPCCSSLFPCRFFSSRTTTRHFHLRSVTKPPSLPPLIQSNKPNDGSLFIQLPSPSLLHERAFSVALVQSIHLLAKETRTNRASSYSYATLWYVTTSAKETMYTYPCGGFIDKLTALSFLLSAKKGLRHQAPIRFVRLETHSRSLTLPGPKERRNIQSRYVDHRLWVELSLMRFYSACSPPPQYMPFHRLPWLVVELRR